MRRQWILSELTSRFAKGGNASKMRVVLSHTLCSVPPLARTTKERNSFPYSSKRRMEVVSCSLHTALHWKVSREVTRMVCNDRGCYFKYVRRKSCIQRRKHSSTNDVWFAQNCICVNGTTFSSATQYCHRKHSARKAREREIYNTIDLMLPKNLFP